MITVNFTILIEVALFLVFLGGANRILFRPLLRIMDAREEKIAQDRATAESSTKEAARLEGLYIENLTKAHQQAAQRLHKARFDAYQENRTEIDRLRAQAEADIAAFRASIDGEVEAERRKLPALMPEVVEAMDHRISAEGSLL